MLCNNSNTPGKSAEAITEGEAILPLTISIFNLQYSFTSEQRKRLNNFFETLKASPVFFEKILYRFKNSNSTAELLLFATT